MENKEIESVRTTTTFRRWYPVCKQPITWGFEPSHLPSQKKQKIECVRDILESLVGSWDRWEIMQKVRKIII